MSHEVESMAWANTVPWHNLGTRVDSNISTQDMLVAAGLDWSVEKIPVGCVDDPTPIKDRFAIRRSTDRKVYSVVSDKWKPVQNSEILNFFRAWADAGEATLETAGSLRGGAQVWALVNLKAGFVLPGGDAVKGYVLMVGSHEVGTATLLRTTAIRVVCANTMALALRGKTQSEVRWSHITDFNADVAREKLGVAREAITEFGVQSERLSKVTMNEGDMVRVLAPIYQPKDDVEDLVNDVNARIPTVTKILWSVNKAPGAVPGTAWGLLNGVTHFSDHMVTGENALHNSWLGYQAKRKEEVYAALTQLAA
jgi:phage/plasmid-like protein (TIGR03299 family)